MVFGSETITPAEIPPTEPILSVLVIAKDSGDKLYEWNGLIQIWG